MFCPLTKGLESVCVSVNVGGRVGGARRPVRFDFCSWHPRKVKDSSGSCRYGKLFLDHMAKAVPGLMAHDVSCTL